MCVEEWKDIKGYEGLYQVSNFGKVKTLGRKRVREKIMNPENNKGYLRVSLSKNNKRKHYFIHYLVAKTFIPNPNALPEINHKDENPLNNVANNLEWCTHVYNLKYGTRCEKVIEKERKPVDQLSLDGTFIMTHYSIQEAGRYLKKSAGPICLCCQNKQSYAYGYLWRYSKGGGE